MLSERRNLIETITPGGHPDHLVPQYGAYDIIFESPTDFPAAIPGGGRIVNEWGVTIDWGANEPGAFPVHDDAHIVVKDIEHWRDYVHMPSYKFSESAWEPVIAHAEQVNRDERFCMMFIAPGLFEQSHYLCEIKNALMYLATNPDEMHELYKYLTEYELIMADEWCSHVHPDALLHHDDWGMQAQTFMRPEMFEEFFLEPYKQIYGYYRERGVELIVHHSDSYAATLVPAMIEMGIDIWQGVLDTNDIPALIERYGGQISFHGGLNNGVYDKADWSREEIDAGLHALLDSVPAGRYLIPGLCAGGPGSTFPGVYEATTEEIRRISPEYLTF